MKRVQYIGQLDCVVFEQRGQKSLKNGVVLEVEPGGAVLTSPQKTQDGRVVAFVVPAELAHLIVDVEGGEPEADTTMRSWATQENERLAKEQRSHMPDPAAADVEIDLETGAEKKAAKPKPKPKPEPKPQRMSHPRGRR